MSIMVTRRQRNGRSAYAEGMTRFQAFGTVIATRSGGLVGGRGGGSSFYSPNGRYRTQFQDDGNVATYDTSVKPVAGYLVYADRMAGLSPVV